MARGRGDFNDSPRGSPRGASGGRGFGPRGRGWGRGRGRGGPPPAPPGAGSGVDYVVQMWPTYLSQSTTEPSMRGQRGSNRGPRAPRGIGRGRGYDSTPKRQHRGFGYSGNAHASLSQLLDRDRPFLKPINFVPSTLTPILFEDTEDILQANHERSVEDAPTAERVMRVFSGQPGFIFTDDSPFPIPDEAVVEEEVEVIDFDDMGRLKELTQGAAIIQKSEGVAIASETTRVVTTDTASAADVQQNQAPALALDDQDSAHDSEIVGFTVDDTPGDVSVSSDLAVQFDRVGLNAPLGGPTSEEDDEIIVYERRTPAVLAQTRTISKAGVVVIDDPATSPESALEKAAPQPTLTPDFNSLSFSFASTSAPRSNPSKRPMKQRKAVRRRTERGGRSAFSLFGAAMADAQERATGPERDPRQAEQRQGDSDLDWGDTLDDDGDDINGGMDVDTDLDAEAFLRSMMRGGGHWTTMDDLEDEAKIREEDEEDEHVESSSSDEDDEEDEAGVEEEALILANEKIMTGEDADEDDEDMSSDEEFGGSFQARLERLRERSRRQRSSQPFKEVADGDDDDEDEAGFGTWADDDELYMAAIQSFLDENEAVLKKKGKGQVLSKKQQKRFDLIHDGLDDASDFLLPSKRGKHKDVPASLQVQWEKDRARKAQRKRERELARLEAASDPMATKKGGRKGKKAMLIAASLDPRSKNLPSHHVHDMSSLEREIRRFIADIGGKASMVLPPQDKATRKKVHEMAQAFGLKSVSKGKGNDRYTTLIRTTRTGVMIDERKIGRVLKRSGGRNFVVGEGSRGGGPSKGTLRPRDGEEVGKAAPKIGESNIGFKLLSTMGWAEGDRIGLSEGLDAPLIAIIKNTKLGLGATR